MFRRLTAFVFHMRPAAGTVSATQICLSQPKQNKNAIGLLRLHRCELPHTFVAHSIRLVAPSLKLQPVGNGQSGFGQTTAAVRPCKEGSTPTSTLLDMLVGGRGWW